MSIFDIFLLSSLFVKVCTLILLGASIWSWSFSFQKWKEIKDLETQTHLLYDMSFGLKNWSSINSRLSGSNSNLIRSIAIKINKCVENNKTTEIYSVIDSILDIQSEKLHKNLDILDSIATISPFIGLLCTVWGITSSFRSMIGGGIDITTIAPGIAEALLATAIGLIVAIPASLSYNRLTAMINTSDTTLSITLKDIALKI
jgi:biopolymer transport protein TolQ